jgi:hypothetical protein
MTGNPSNIAAVAILDSSEISNLGWVLKPQSLQSDSG